MPNSSITPDYPRHRVLKSGLSLLAARYAQPVLSFALFAVAARFLSLTDLGAYVILISFIFIFQAAAVLGLGPLLTREIALDLPATKGWLGGMLTLAIPASLVAWLAFPLCSLGLNYSQSIVTGSVIMGASLPLSAGIQSAEAVFLAHGRSWALCTPSLIECTVRLILSAVLLVNGYGLNALLWAYTASRLIGLIVCAVFLYPLVGGEKNFWDRKKTRILAAGIPTFGLMFVAAIVFFRVDVIIVARIMGEDAAGIYGAAYRVVVLTFLLPESFVAAFFPVLSRKLTRDRLEISELVRVILRLMLGLELPMILALAAVSEWLLPLIFGRTFAASGELVTILAFVLLPHSINSLLGFLLQADKKEKTALGLVLFGLAAHVLIMWAFVSWLGIAGAAAGLLLSTLILAFAHIMVTSRYIFPLGVSRTLLSVILGGLTGWWILKVLPEGWPISRLLLASGASLVFLVGLGTVNITWLNQAWTRLRDARG